METMSEKTLVAFGYVCGFCGEEHEIKLIEVNGQTIQTCPWVPSASGGFVVDKKLMPSAIRAKGN